MITKEMQLFLTADYDALKAERDQLRAELAESRKNFAELQAELLASDTSWSDEMTRSSKLEAELAALKAKAAVPEIVPQWGKSLSHCWPKCEASKEGDWCVGHISEDGDFYDVLTVEASQYDADGESQKIAEAIVALWAFAEAAPAQPQSDGVLMPVSDVEEYISLLIDEADAHLHGRHQPEMQAHMRAEIERVRALLGGEA